MSEVDIMVIVVVLIGIFAALIKWKSRRDLKQRYLPAIEEIILQLASIEEDWNRLIDEEHYFTGSEMDAYCARYKDPYEILSKCESHGAFRFIRNTDHKKRLKAFTDLYKNIQTLRDQRNGLCRNGNLWIDYQCDNPRCRHQSREFHNFQ